MAGTNAALVVANTALEVANTALEGFYVLLMLFFSSNDPFFLRDLKNANNAKFDGISSTLDSNAKAGSEEHRFGGSLHVAFLLMGFTPDHVSSFSCRSLISSRQTWVLRRRSWRTSASETCSSFWKISTIGLFYHRKRKDGSAQRRKPSWKILLMRGISIASPMALAVQVGLTSFKCLWLMLKKRSRLS